MTARIGNHTVVRTYRWAFEFNSDASLMARAGYNVVSSFNRPGQRHNGFNSDGRMVVTYQYAGPGHPPVGDGRPVYGKNQQTANQIMLSAVIGIPLGILLVYGLVALINLI